MDDKFYKNLNKLDFKSFQDEILYLIEKNKLHYKDKHGRNLLFWMDDIQKVKYLVNDLNVEYDLLSDNNCSPIFFKNPEVTEFYFHKGLDINKESNDCFSVLSVANPETTMKLVELGVNLNDANVFSSWIPKSEYEKQKEKVNLFHNKIRFLYSKGMSVKNIPYFHYDDDLELLKIMTDNKYEMNLSGMFYALNSMLRDNNIPLINYLNENYLKKNINDFFSSILSKNNFIINLKMLNFLNENYEIDTKLKVDGLPWFFKAILSEDAMVFLEETNTNFYEKNDMAESIIFYKNKSISHDDNMDELFVLINFSPELMLEKNNNGLNFFEVMDNKEKNRFIELIIINIQDQEYEENEIVKKENENFYNNIIEKVVFPYIEKNGGDFLNKNEESSILKEKYSQYEKEKIKKNINNNMQNSKNTFRRL